jgi:hypothetical protein
MLLHSPQQGLCVGRAILPRRQTNEAKSEADAVERVPNDAPRCSIRSTADPRSLWEGYSAG